MQLGFVSAVLSELSLEEVLAFAADEGFGCVELMCWPPGAAERRYAGVCHVDVTHFDDAEAHRVRDIIRIHGVAVSGLSGDRRNTALGGRRADRPRRTVRTEGFADIARARFLPRDAV